MTQYNRSASIIIGPVGGQGVIIRDLRIHFVIEKTEGKDPNTAKIEIYNLAKETRDLVRDIGQQIILNAGYLDGDGEQVCFSGNVTSISHKIMPPNVISIIEANDGKLALGSSKLSISRGSGSSAKQILKDILDTFPLSNNLQTVQINDKKYANGFSFSGMSKSALTKVSDFLDLSWSIQNSEVRLVPFDGNDKTTTTLLNPSTGLINSPQRVTGEVRKSQKLSKKAKPGWKFESLLLPKVNPSNLIAVESKEITPVTFFTVTTIVHRGDTHGQEWTSEIEVKDNE